MTVGMDRRKQSQAMERSGEWQKLWIALVKKKEEEKSLG